MEEAWIECRLPGQTYWVEIPYGFTRNPADPLTPTRAIRGGPALAPAMKSIDPKDRILPWAYVTYDLGEIQNQWRAEVHVTNPGDAAADVVLYRGDTAVGKSMYLWNLQTPTTNLEIDDPTGGHLTPLPFGIRLHEDGSRRSDSFKFFRDGNSDLRGWGTATLKVDDRSYSFTLPSSLFKFLHGVLAPPGYPVPLVPRTAPCIQNPLGVCLSA